jgi:arsenite methyltransferase
MPHFTDDQIRTIVRDAYGDVKSSGTAVAETFYSAEELGRLPRAVAELALGVGHPLRRAHLAPGEVVLDIGCGAGIDTLLAAIAVGPKGQAIGLDMTPEMVDRARHHAELSGLDNVKIVHGLAEAIPLEDESVDVVISNGVLNLCNRKSRVIAEIARVLRPGGRVSIADLVVTDHLPDEILKHPAAVAG